MQPPRHHAEPYPARASLSGVGVVQSVASVQGNCLRASAADPIRIDVFSRPGLSRPGTGTGRRPVSHRDTGYGKERGAGDTRISGSRFNPQTHYPGRPIFLDYIEHLTVGRSHHRGQRERREIVVSFSVPSVVRSDLRRSAERLSPGLVLGGPSESPGALCRIGTRLAALPEWPCPSVHRWPGGGR